MEWSPENALAEADLDQEIIKEEVRPRIDRIEKALQSAEQGREFDVADLGVQINDLRNVANRFFMELSHAGVAADLENLQQAHRSDVSHRKELLDYAHNILEVIIPAYRIRLRHLQRHP